MKCEHKWLNTKSIDMRISDHYLLLVIFADSQVDNDGVSKLAMSMASSMCHHDGVPGLIVCIISTPENSLLHACLIPIPYMTISPKPQIIVN